jgi:hypothetical protein
MNHRAPHLALIATLAVGCGVSVEYVPLNTPPHAMKPRPPGSVDVYASNRPERPFVEVGMIEAQQESAYSQAPPEQIVAEMRGRAGELGCDGLMLTGGNDAVVGGGSVANGSGSSWARTLKGYRGTCIMYKAEAPPPLATAVLVPASTTGTCDPPCSPGYRCEGATCVALCNPGCPGGMICGSDRVCRRP